MREPERVPGQLSSHEAVSSFREGLQGCVSWASQYLGYTRYLSKLGDVILDRFLSGHSVLDAAF